LHPEEKRLLKAKASDFADKLRQAGYGAMTEERALAILTEQAENRVDETQANRTDTETMDDNLKAEARKYINQISSPAGTYDDGRGNQIKYFTNTTASGDRRVEDDKNPNINAVPHVPAVDYVTVQGGGLGLGGAATVNMHNGEVFLGPSKSNISSGAGGSVTVGRMLDDPPEFVTRGNAVSNMLGGASAQTAVCAAGLCVGVNQSIGKPGERPTAVEIGFGTPGVSTGVGVSLPVPGTKK
jgi:filamentous hemagglutinin